MTDAINLFEFKRILCCLTESKSPGRCTNLKIECYAWTSNNSNRFNCLAIYLTNARFILYSLNENGCEKANVRQIPWLSDGSKKVEKMTFSPNGAWLLIVVKDSTVYLIPAIKLMEPHREIELKWPLDDITEIKVQGRRASPTSIVWWDTRDGRSIAIVGNELGEISFINLLLSREVGGTYITVGIQHLELVEDHINVSVYLLITGVNNVQWQLVLERHESEYCLPLENHSLSSTKSESSGFFASCEAKRPTVADGKHEDTRPKRLDAFAGHTYLKLQSSLVPNKIAGYFEQNSILSMHSSDLHLVPFSVYKVPPNTIRYAVQDKVLFVVSPLECDRDQKYAIQILSTELATSSIDGSKKFDPQSRLQYFYLDPEDDILSILSWNSLGCIVVTTQNVYRLNLRVSIEDMFTQIVLQGDLVKAERFGKLFGLNLSDAYEKVANQRLADGLVTAAIRLYQTAKCSHVQSVAKFASHGHVSEVLSYIRILFSSKNNTFSLTDYVQLSNMAMLCYLHQCLELSVGSKPHFNNFRVFLKENQYYDEKLAVHLLVKYEMYDLLTEFAVFRGKFGLVMEELLPQEDAISLWPDGQFCMKSSWIEEDTVKIMADCGYQNITRLDQNDLFVECLLHECLIGCFDLREDLLWRHMLLTKSLLLSWSHRPDIIRRLLKIYNPANLKYASSLIQNRTSSTYDQYYDNLQGSEVYQLFPNRSTSMSSYFLSLMLAYIKAANLEIDYKSSLIVPKNLLLKENEVANAQPTFMVKKQLVDCGFAHSAVVVNGAVYTWGRTQDGCLGRESMRNEWLPAEPLSLIQNSFIRVISVACGASHTLVQTDAGVYAWGSNRYGQLGLGKAAPAGLFCQRSQPTCVTLLANLNLCEITCGQYHSLARTAEGVVYTWGWGVHGQLGHGNAQDCDTPTPVKSLKCVFISNISAGYAHSLFQSKEGDVYVCGCGTFGQLGNGIASKRSIPFKVPLNEKILLSSAGYFHNVVIGVSGKLIAWGCNPQTLRIRAQVSRRARILNHTSSPDYIPSITLVPGVFNPTEIYRDEISSTISQVACGLNHTVVLTTDGEVFSWGRNLDGQLGVEDRKERMSPIAIGVVNDRKIVQISCGADFTLLLDNVGKLWGFGVDSYGQICGAIERGKWSQPNVIMSPNKIITVRTNRRVVQIKSPTRNSIYKPSLLNGIPQIYDTKNCHEGAQPVSSVLVKYLNVEGDADTINDTFHYALEILHGGYDVEEIKAACVECHLFQAAAKVSLLSKTYSESYGLILKSITVNDESIKECCLAVIHLLEQYLSLTSHDCKCQCNILSSTFTFWMSHSLPLDTLEYYLKENITSSHLVVPLLYIVFGISDEIHGPCPLSSQFCFDIVHNVLEKVNQSDLDPEFVNLVTQINDGDFDRSIGGGDEVDRTSSGNDKEEEINQKSYIDISASELDRLRRVLPTTNAGEGGNKSATVLKVFSCGHLHTLGSFHRMVLPLLKDSLNYIAPSTTKQLADNYANMDCLPMACPKCLAVGFQRDRMELAEITS